MRFVNGTSGDTALRVVDRESLSFSNTSLYTNEVEEVFTWDAFKSLPLGSMDWCLC